jgi:hypothetical protein
VAEAEAQRIFFEARPIRRATYNAARGYNTARGYNAARGYNTAEASACFARTTNSMVPVSQRLETRRVSS